MERNTEKHLWTGLGLLLAFALWTLLIRCVDVRAPTSVPLFAVTGLSPWIKKLFAAVIALTVLNGICGVVISHLDRPVWDRHRLVTGLALSVTGTALFIMTRQPYAGILCLTILVIKGLLIAKRKDLP